jgi:hypothetical protein
MNRFAVHVVLATTGLVGLGMVLGSGAYAFDETDLQRLSDQFSSSQSSFGSFTGVSGSQGIDASALQQKADERAAKAEEISAKAKERARRIQERQHSRGFGQVQVQGTATRVQVEREHRQQIDSVTPGGSVIQQQERSLTTGRSERSPVRDLQIKLDRVERSSLQGR